MTILRVYADCLQKTFGALARSPWTLLLPMTYLAILTFATALLAPLGQVGGLLILIVRDLLFSSFLYVISELVRGLPVRLQEMPKSVQAFFWPIINVLFVLWIVSIVLSFSGNTSLVLPVLAVEFIILNAVPEIIYQKQIYGGLNTIAASVNFIQENWIEWFIPNVAFAAAMLFLFLGGFGVSPLIDRLPFGGVVVPVLMGAFVHCAFVFRGFLFAALDGSSARQRAMKYR